jgi:broad specificity phosphatase PhoE
VPKLYLVRHAEPAITGVLLGGLDPDLSLAGKRAAGELRLPHVAIVYSSALKRALSTAITVCPHFPDFSDRESGDIPRYSSGLLVDSDLNEISYGDWDGLSWAEIERRYPAIVRPKLANWQGVTPPGGEPWADFENRVDRALERIRRGPTPAAVIAHQTVNAHICYRLTGSDPFEYSQSYCEVRVHDF